MAETKFKNECGKRKLNAEKVSQITGIKKRTIESYLYGERFPSRNNRIILRDKLGIDTKIFD